MTEVVSETSSDELVDLARLARTSFELILRLQDQSGAYPASPTFSAYRGYSWLRDGSFIADGISSFGGIESAERFFDWCSGVLTARAANIAAVVAAAAAGAPVEDSRMLGARFTLAGADGTDEWWDFQLDGYGTWLWALSEHARRHGRSMERWLPAILLTVDYLLSSWRRPCFDWWEESAEEVHVSTLGCIAAGLNAVATAGMLDEARRVQTEIAVGAIRELIRSAGTVRGHLAKWLGSTEVDASLASLIAPLGVFPAADPLAAATIRELDAMLNVRGGVHRYVGDTFYGGGQWPLLSCMLGLGFSALGDREAALRHLRWAASTTTADGYLPEQVAGHLLDASKREEWVDRWGTVATPLLWSHAMYIRLAVDLNVAHGGAA